MVLTAPEIEQFHEQGYVVKSGVYDEAALHLIQGALTAIISENARRLMAEGKLAELFKEAPFDKRLALIMAASPEAGQEIYNAILGGGGGGFSGPEMFAMLIHPPLLSCIESLIGPEIVGSSVYRVRPKLPNFAHGEVPWHQDSGYFEPHCDDALVVTCWLPLVDATLDNGCLWVQPGQHNSGIIRHHAGGHAGYLEILGDDLPPVDSIPIEMKAGDVLFMTNMTPHCSKENTTDLVRWSLDLRYQGVDVPNNVGESPEDFAPDRPEWEIACYPPEADFIIRSPSHPEREVRSATEFHEIRERFQNGPRFTYSKRIWEPAPENA